MPKLPDPRSIFKIRKILEAEDFDIVHAHGHLAGLYARVAALGLRDTRTVYTLHGIHYPHYRNPLKRTAFVMGERILKRSTDRFICVCRSDLETGRAIRIVDPDRTDVIYNGIDPDAVFLPHPVHQGDQPVVENIQEVPEGRVPRPNPL